MAKHAMSSEKASNIKKMGHKAELEFNILFGDKSLSDMNFSGSSEDCYVIKNKYKELIKNKLNLVEDNLSVSLKTGSTWQFHLGRIDEISQLGYIKDNISRGKDLKGKDLTIVKYSKPFEEQLIELKSKSFWNKYLNKGNLLCYYDKYGTYTFFEMSKVIDSIISNFEWRILQSGRIKGDCIINNKLCKGVITIEYREEPHNSLVLGSSGGSNGYRLFLMLKSNTNYIELSPFK
jgi:hypothetical protein